VKPRFVGSRQNVLGWRSPLLHSVSCSRQVFEAFIPSSRGLRRRGSAKRVVHKCFNQRQTLVNGSLQVFGDLDRQFHLRFPFYITWGAENVDTLERSSDGGPEKVFLSVSICLSRDALGCVSMHELDVTGGTTPEIHLDVMRLYGRPSKWKALRASASFQRNTHSVTLNVLAFRFVLTFARLGGIRVHQRSTRDSSQWLWRGLGCSAR